MATVLPPPPEFDISSVTIEEEMKSSYLDYAMSVIVSRALPDVRYVNPANGGPVTATIDSYMQLLPKGMETETLQSSAAWIYSVVEGTGKTVIGDVTFEWGPRDVFVVPGWYPHHHQADGDAFLFSFTDKIIQEKLGLYRERRRNVTH